MKRLLSALALSAALAAPAAAQGPSFDCGRAQTMTEFAICGNPELARLDRVLADAYAAALSRGDATVRDRQRAWLQGRDDCRGDHGCLAQRMRTRLAELTAPAPQAGATRPAALDGAYCPDNATGFSFTDRGDHAIVSISLFQANGHACGTGQVIARAEGDGYVVREGDCVIGIGVTGTDFRISTDTVQACHALYCGARAAITEIEVPFSSRSPRVQDPSRWSWMEQGC